MTVENARPATSARAARISFPLSFLRACDAYSTRRDSNSLKKDKSNRITPTLNWLTTDDKLPLSEKSVRNIGSDVFGESGFHA